MAKNNAAVQALWAQRWSAQRTLEATFQYASTEVAVGLPVEPEEILVINGYNHMAYNALVADLLEADIVSIDSEWRPDWCDASDNPVAVLQLAFPYSRRAYLLQLSQLGQLPVEVQGMLRSPHVLKVGFAVNNKDRSKFERSGILLDGDILDVQTICEMLLDPSGLAVHPRSLGLTSAVSSILGENMAKDKRISCSDWARKVLTGDQIFYAAMDAWATLRLFGAIAQRVIDAGGVSQCLGTGALSAGMVQSVSFPESHMLAECTQGFAAECLIISPAPRSEKSQHEVASTTSPEGSPAPSSRGSFNTSPSASDSDASATGGVEPTPPHSLEHRPLARRRRHTRHHHGHDDDEDAYDKASIFPATILSLCLRDLHTHRWHKLALSYILSFLLFPPGLPCVVLLPLHLLLMQAMHCCKVLPTLPSHIFSAYLVGSLTRLLVGVCAHGYRHWIG
mmetsp:Transcript_66113/g.158163  ORF Transcript_66113/g.158163 Transcript_66113/m.158163 type:complete len:451 (-) Transcript_66113:225-1577(-)